MRKIFGLALFFVLTANAAAQNFSETHRKIQTAIENRDYSAAAGELQTLRKSNKKIFELNNYDYLLARTAERRGDFALAAANFQSVAARNSVLKEYALRHLAEIARSSGNLMLERLYLREIQAIAPESLSDNFVSARLARSFFESQNYDSAINLFNAQTFSGDQNSKIKAQTDNRLSRENLVLLGESYLQTGKKDEARNIFNKLVNELPNRTQPDDFALAGAKGLDILDGGTKEAAPNLPEAEHLGRAQIYQFNRDFADARLHYEAIVKNYPASQILPDALYQIGRGLALEENFVRAIEWFERVHSEFPDSPIAPDALSQAASAFSRVNKPKVAVARYQKIIEKYPEHARLDRAYLNIVDVLRDGGENASALKWAQKTQEVFRGKPPEAVALFAQARIHIAQNDWQNALADLEKLLTFPDLGGTRVPGGATVGEITFLRGFALEQLNRFPEAIDAYLLIPDGRNEYFGWRATEKLKALAGNEKSKAAAESKIGLLVKNIETRNAEARRRAAQDVLRISDNAAIRAKMLEIVKKSYTSLPDYQKLPDFRLLEFGRKDVLQTPPKSAAQKNHHKDLADELLFLGLYDEATPELEKSLSETENPKPKTDDLNYTLAVFYRRGDMAHRAVGFIEPLWRKIPADYFVELMPRDQAELLYPAPYVDALLQFAPERKVDPRFALSIMRQESRFRADVKSYAAARGLMQFISSTAAEIAGQIGRENFNQDELYNPPVAVLFGSQYLANLFRQFPNQPPAVAASYNGGETNMARWLARSNSNDPDRYVSEIVFSQSKDYVYKVMTNYRIYQMLYDENLKIK